MAVRFIENSVANRFDYAMAAQLGSIFPNDDPVKIQIATMEPPAVIGAVPEQQHSLSHDEYTKLIEGRAYVAAYLQATYCDIFRIPHIIRRCVASGIDVKDNDSLPSCFVYNIMDTNTTPDFRACPAPPTLVK